MSEELTVLFRQSAHHLFNAARQFSILSLLPFIAPLVFIFLLTGCGEKDTHKLRRRGPFATWLFRRYPLCRSMCEPEKYVPMMKPCSLSD
jgi:hypothetical protein